MHPWYPKDVTFETDSDNFISFASKEDYFIEVFNFYILNKIYYFLTNK